MDNQDAFSTPESTPTQPRRKPHPPGTGAGSPMGGLITPPTTQMSAGGAAPGGGSVLPPPSGPPLHYHRSYTRSGPIGTSVQVPAPIVTVAPYDPQNPPTTPPARRQYHGPAEHLLTDQDFDMGEDNRTSAQSGVRNAVQGDSQLEQRYRKEAAQKKDESKRKRAVGDVGAPENSSPPKKPSGGGLGPLQKRILQLEKQLETQKREEAERLARMEENIALLTSLATQKPAEAAKPSERTTTSSTRPRKSKSGGTSRNKPVSNAGPSGSRGTSRAAPGSTSGSRSGTGGGSSSTRQPPVGNPQGTGGGAAGGSRSGRESQAPTTNTGGGRNIPSGPGNTGGSGEEQDDAEGEDQGQDQGTKRRGRYRHQYQLGRNGVPEGAEGMKYALMFHIRVMWNQVDRRSIPYDPSSDLLKSFDERFTTEDDLYNQRYADPLIQAQEVNIEDHRKLQRDTKNKNYMRLKLIPDTAIVMMKTTVARYGLRVWAPDLRQAPYGLYNSACRMSAVDSFRQAITANVYAMFKPDTRLNSNIDFLIKVYDHTVHYMHYRRYLRELALPGANEAQDAENTATQNRRRLAESRGVHATRNGYPPRYQMLFKTKATSDDERDPDNSREGIRPVFWIKKRTERASWANEFYRLFQDEHDLFHQLAPNKHQLDRVRRIPPNGIQKESAFKRLPKMMPLDYYDPAFYNRLPPHLRALIADENLMVFLPNVKETFQRPDLENLSDEEFMAIPEIAERRKLYNIPDDAVLQEAEGRGDNDDDFVDEEEYEGDEMDLDKDGNDVDASVPLGGEEVEEEENRRNRLANSAA